MKDWMKFLLSLAALGVLFILGIALIIGIFFNPMKTVTMAIPTAAPTPAANLAPTTPAASTAASMPADCHVINDYQLKDLPEVSTSNGEWLHVEYWVGGDAPEYETILPGGRYLLQVNFAGGHVWEYSGCTYEQVYNQVLQHIDRRIAQEANNAGYIDWESTGFFEPVP